MPATILPAVSTPDLANRLNLGDDGPQTLHDLVNAIYDNDTPDLAAYQWCEKGQHTFHYFGRRRRFEYGIFNGEVTVARVRSGLRLVHGGKVYSADSTVGRRAQKVFGRIYPYLAPPDPSKDPLAAAFDKLADAMFARTPGLFSYPYQFTTDRKFPGQVVVRDETFGSVRRVERKPKGWLAVYDAKSGAQYSLPHTDEVVREITQVRQHKDGRVASYWQIAELDGLVRPPLQ